MQKIIDQITDHLVGLVTADKPAYNPKELLKAGIPSFIVERVRMSLEDKIREELGSHTSEWYEADNRLVEDAWSDFLRTAISTSHIPKEELYRVLNSVVKDIIYVFIEPRKNMAEYVFRDDEELSYDELELRCSRLTIYKHFGTAIPLYMKKRKLDTLSKERCKQLIHKLDAKLVASYSAQDWAQKLEQLFVLFNGKVDPKLLSTFFEDKGLYNLAQKFSRRRKLITKTDFIYIISNESLTDFREDEPDEGVEAKEGKIAEDEAKKISEEDDSEQTLIESFFGEYEYKPGEEEEEEDSLAGKYLEGGLTDDEMTELLSDIASDGVVEVDDYDHVASLNELFSISKREEEEEEGKSETSEEIAASIKSQNNEDDGEEIKAFRDNLISILDQAKNSYENMSAEEKQELEDAETKPEKKEEKPEATPEKEEVPEGEDLPEDEDSPMWAQFLSPDQMEVIMGSKREGESQKGEEDSEKEREADDEEAIEVEDSVYSDEPLIDEDQEVQVPLADILEDRKEEFIEVIFSGSTDSYKKAVSKIEKFKTWKETSKFIQKDVFNKNDVDMLSGATVDFTDRLHSYFNNSRNT